MLFYGCSENKEQCKTAIKLVVSTYQDIYINAYSQTIPLELDEKCIPKIFISQEILTNQL